MNPQKLIPLFNAQLSTIFGVDLNVDHDNDEYSKFVNDVGASLEDFIFIASVPDFELPAVIESIPFKALSEASDDEFEEVAQEIDTDVVMRLAGLWALLQMVSDLPDPENRGEFHDAFAGPPFNIYERMDE